MFSFVNFSQNKPLRRNNSMFLNPFLNKTFSYNNNNYDLDGDEDDIQLEINLKNWTI